MKIRAIWVITCSMSLVPVTDRRTTGLARQCDPRDDESPGSGSRRWPGPLPRAGVDLGRVTTCASNGHRPKGGRGRGERPQASHVGAIRADGSPRIGLAPEADGCARSNHGLTPLLTRRGSPRRLQIRAYFAVYLPNPTGPGPPVYQPLIGAPPRRPRQVCAAPAGRVPDHGRTQRWRPRGRSKPIEEMQS
jgi:hypothetical protein